MGSANDAAVAGAKILRAYVRHYNQQRPHRSLALAVPSRRNRTPRPRGFERTGAARCLAASSTRITRLQHDESRFRAPQVRAEGLDWLLVVSRGYLEQVLRVYVRHYNGHRPDRALILQPPDPPVQLTIPGEDDRGAVHRRDLLGGLLHEYRQAA
jgi:hypothetical protein